MGHAVNQADIQLAKNTGESPIELIVETPETRKDMSPDKIRANNGVANRAGSIGVSLSV